MINYTVKLILWKPGTDENTACPIYTRITIDRKTAYLATGHTTIKKLWNEKTETVKGANKINSELTTRKSTIIGKIVEMNVAGKSFTAKSIKEHFSGKDLNNIFTFIDAYCVEVKHKKDDQTIQVYKNHSRKLEKFHGSRDLHFENITVEFLSRYEKHLRSEGVEGKDVDKKNNYVHAIWKTLKAFFNAAKKRKLITNYPFDEYENPIYKDPQKDYLTLDELKAWENFADETDNPVYKETAVYFLLGCYSGLRISDWKAFHIQTHVVNGMVRLRARKNGEWLSIPLNGPLARNIERMRLVPLTIEEPTLNQKLKVIAEKLKLNKTISSHCGRKTFAVTMCADRGVSLEVCATLMGITVSVCLKNYYRITDYKINKEVSAAWAGL